MSCVQDLLREKGKRVVSISFDATVRQAAEVMNDHHVGALIVLDDRGVAGIFTERDVLRRVVAPGLDPGRVVVGKVMTAPIVYVNPHTKLDEVRAVFRDQRIRHLPVLDDRGRIVGMISIGDLNAHRLDDQAVTIAYMEQYIHGV